MYGEDCTIAFGPTAIADLGDSREMIDTNLRGWLNGEYVGNVAVMTKGKGYWVEAKTGNVYLRFPAPSGIRRAAIDRDVDRRVSNNSPPPPINIELRDDEGDGGSRGGGSSGCFIDAVAR